MGDLLGPHSVTLPEALVLFYFMQLSEELPTKSGAGNVGSLGGAVAKWGDFHNAKGSAASEAGYRWCR